MICLVLGDSDLSDSSVEYLQQFIELLRPLLIQHLQRFESQQGFPTMKFLERYFAFTFRIPACDLFLNCVDIWSDLLDRILAISTSRVSQSKTSVLQSYSTPVLALVDHILMRIQVHFNKKQLEELSDEDNSGNEGLSELDDFLARCVGVIIKAGEIMPKEILEKLVGRYSELQTSFLSLQSILRTGK